jgi:hypothetical protein
VLRYLARYVFRTALTSNRLVSFDETGVAFRHKHRASNRWRVIRLQPHEFMRRFLQHVLPKGLHKVRYFGLWHPAKRDVAARVRLLLQLEQRGAVGANATPSASKSGIAEDSANEKRAELRPCPCCQQGCLIHVRRLYPKQPGGP